MVTEPRIRVSVDRDRCIASGQCLYAEPAVFDQDEDSGIVILLDETPAPEHHDNVTHAARTCPSQAIHVESADGTGDGRSTTP